jgi:hypothetical protein
MTLIFHGKTRCKICEQLIVDGEDITSFSHFVRNEADPYYFFTDAAFHTRCLQSHSQCERVTAVYRAFSHYNQHKIDQLSGNVFTTADTDFVVGLGYLTDDPENPLFEYNFLYFDDRTLSQWSELPTLVTLLQTERAAGRWVGWGADYLLAAMESALKKRS